MHFNHARINLIVIRILTLIFSLIHLNHSRGMNSRVTPLKFVCPRISHYACYYSACRRRGGVLKCPRFCFFFFFFFGVESWAAAHGLYRCTEYRLLSEPMSTRLLNSISSRICRQNTQFNMYTTTSKQQEGCTFKDSHPKCFITTNFDKFHREAFARGGESRYPREVSLQ